MLKLEDIQKDDALSGVEPDQVVRVVATELIGEDALTLYYRTADGRLGERMLFRTDESQLSLAKAGRPWSFEADGADFKLVAEAWRIHLAHLFDPMMAVHTSNVEPLPHQITAVYESMLPRQPLRYVLADDPGAGKTIMAGLLIRELIMRADVRRVLIVAPGSLVDQWQDEMFEKFGLEFTIFSREQIEQSRSANPFETHDQLIARIDQLARNEDLLQKLRHTTWDLVVVDEAHKMSASYYGQKLNRTRRFQLGELLGTITRHFLLMTATPHNGKEEDFQLFMSLLDRDRFFGKFRDGAHRVEVSDLMRRMVKEEMLRFDGTRLFPERRSYTANYELSAPEAALYAAVTEYVKEEMNRADQLDGQRKGTVGFALTTLQRRLASSPNAIYESLRRRRERLTRRVEEEKTYQRGEGRRPDFDADLLAGLGAVDDIWEADEALASDDYEALEEQVVDQATAAQTIQELEAEILILEDLEAQAREVVYSQQDRKWEELSRLLQDTPEMRDASGNLRKLILFTEHKDTLNYLVARIRGLIGQDDAIVVIHGGVRREERRQVQEAFRNGPAVRVLVATDAAGEGVNLQNANLMVNYDLPWNPNRLEQRFGRIHRIGQTEVCHLWNMVASETREGDVFQRLFEKLEVERQALGGRVFDILGEVFDNKSLKELLMEAIRYGDDPAVRARLHQKVEGKLDTRYLKDILARNALSEEIMDPGRLFAVKEEMEKAEARRLQPYFIRAFFTQAFERLGGRLNPRENGRWQIGHVPGAIRTHDRKLRDAGHHLQEVVSAYERVCFEKQYVRLARRPGAPMASLIHPGHPLMYAATDLILSEHRALLKEGAVLVDPADQGVTPRALVILDHTVREGTDASRHVSRRMQFIALQPDGQVHNAGWAPHLDLEPISPEDLALIQDELHAPWLTQGLEQAALAHAARHLVPQHFEQVRRQRQQRVDKTLKAVQERLVKEINYLGNRIFKYQQEIAAGKDRHGLVEMDRRTVDELTSRLNARKKELDAMRHVVSATPVVVGGALVIPAGLISRLRGEPESDATWSADATARTRIELLAMKAVMDAEEAMGHQVIDVSAEKCGWDITSRPPATDGKLPPARHIEVKGRAAGQASITITKNEILYGLNQTDKFLLAIVLVDGDQVDGPYYVRDPFTREPDWAVTSLNYDLNSLLSRATDAQGSR